MKVGVFDSGLGGLTVLNAIIKQLKGAEIFYIADTLYAPYGDKNKDEIFLRSEKITNFLLKNYEIDALVIACNTATSVAIKHLREVFPSLIIIGTEPGMNHCNGRFIILILEVRKKFPKFLHQKHTLIYNGSAA